MIPSNAYTLERLKNAAMLDLKALYFSRHKKRQFTFFSPAVPVKRRLKNTAMFILD